MNVRSGELSITLADDDIMIRLNRGYLKREGTTDVMAFPLWAGDEPPLGDVYIGLQQAARQADALGVPLREELARLAIHGSLHVLGLDHPEDAAREDSEMWRVQERILRSVMET
jgi:probable rRNA maturation factor